MNELTLHVKSFNELTLNELYSLLHIRSQVFVNEQNCVYQDLDFNDQLCIHAWLTRDDKIVAMLRVCPAGVTNIPNVSIGRVITTERGKGYGEMIVRHGLRLAVERLNAKAVQIHAQDQARGFYEKVGFHAISEPYIYEGLPHLDMLWTPQ